jgi:hypothetical protein
MYAKADLASTMCEVVAFFDDEDELHDVVEELQIVGFDRTEISVMPSRKVVEKRIGHELRTVVEVAYNPDVPRAVPVDRASLGLAQGALVAGPLYVASCGAVIALAASSADLATVANGGHCRRRAGRGAWHLPDALDDAAAPAANRRLARSRRVGSLGAYLRKEV